METLNLASNNAHKAEEIRAVLNNRFCIVTLKEAGIDIDIPEPFETLLENAHNKSQTIFTLSGKDCFSEDTGLEVAALNGEPGVRSARYAGEPPDNEKNIDKLLANLARETQRDAQFRTVISLILDKAEYQFEGTCKGKIIDIRRGSYGFGYDAIFIPEGAEKTFGEMTLPEKAIFSHRKKATEKFVAFLNEYNAQDKN